MLLDGSGWTNGEAQYDVIDTINVSDIVGILSVLPATVPLLKRSLFSTLRTETPILPYGNAARALEDRLCAETTTMSLLAGLSSRSQLTGELADSNVTETALLMSQQGWEGKFRYYRMRTSWKVAESGDNFASFEKHKNIRINPFELSDMIFGVLKKMCAYGHTSLNAIGSNDSEQRVNQFVAYEDAKIYHPLTFVALLRLVEQNVSTDWSGCIRQLGDKIKQFHTHN